MSSLKKFVAVGVAATVVAASLVSCAAGEPPERGGADCGTPEAACSLNDVEPEVLTRMIDLGDEAYEYSQQPGVTWGDVGHFLTEQDDVINVTLTPVEISFQVAGAPPSYLLSELAAPSDDSEPADDGASWPGPSKPDLGEPDPNESDPNDSETPDWFPEDLDRSDDVAGTSFSALASTPQGDGIVRDAAWTPSSAGATIQSAALPALRQEPVGEPGVGHDRAPTKRAFIFEPYGPMGARAVPQDLAGELGAQDQYTVDFYGDVTSYDDSATILNALMSLGHYDVVYISSHGAANGFAASQARDWFVKNPGEETYSIPADRPLPHGVGTTKGPDGVMRFYVTNEFFEYHYPGGLHDTLVFADWCQSALGDTLGSSLLGPGSVYLGWDQSVGVELAARASRYFWEGAVDWRVDSDAAYDNVVEHGAHFQSERNIVSHGIDCARGTDEGSFNCPERYTSTLRIFTAKNPLHVIDTVTSHSNDKRIRKGNFLAWSGDADDGVKDTLDEVQLEVVGIVPGQAGAAGFVEIMIDGKKIEEKFPVIEMPVTDTDGTHWEERTIDLEDLELPFDVTAEQLLRELPWEVRLVGPNDAISMHDVNGVRLAGPAITVVDPEFSHDLDNADDLPADDEENDGEPGRTTIALHVEDIAEDVASNYRVEVEVTGGTLQGKRELEWPLTEFRYLGESQWRKDETFDLDLDLKDETRPLTVAARVVQVDLGLDVAEHSPNLLLRGRTADFCSAEITMTGELRSHGSTFAILTSDTPKPIWYSIFPGESLWFEPTEGQRDLVRDHTSYDFIIETDGIEPGATGTFTRPGKILWTKNHDQFTALSILVFGDVTLNITDHTTTSYRIGGTLEEPEYSDLETNTIKGTVSGQLKYEGGPDTPGFIDVHATFAYSDAGCYPDPYPDN